MTYEYLCTSCKKEWEAEQSISEAPLKECPHCHASTARRQVSGGAGFILKGGGWFADGYGSKKNESSTNAEGSAKDEAKGGAPKGDDGGAKKEAGASTTEKPASESKSDASGEKKTESTKGAKGTGKAPAAA